jgi:ribosomal protein S7
MGNLGLFSFIKKIIMQGKQTVAYKIIFDCFFYLNISSISLYIWSALKVIEPLVEVRVLRRGGRIYFVPFSLSSNRAISLSRRWVITRSKKRKARSMGHCLALEFKDIYSGVGGSILKRNQNQIQALVNRGNVGFRWLIFLL